MPLSSFNMSVTINDNGQSSATRDVKEFNTFDNWLKTTVDTELNFSYNTDNEFNQKISALKGFVEISVFHMNIRSLNKNDNKLYNFLLTLNLAFDVIVLSEIWDHNLELYGNLFDGYTFYSDTCASSRVGGIGVYVKFFCVCNKLDSLKINSNNNTVENIWLEIYRGKHKYVLVAIYGHPNQHIDDFNALLDARLCEIRKSNTPCIIAGDFNIDLCKYSSHNATTEYVNSLLINNFLPAIVMPTRITEISATIIDHIYYYEGINGKQELTVVSGNLWCDISDHLPNYILITGKAKQKINNDRPLLDYIPPVICKNFSR